VVAKVNAASVPRSERILGRANCLVADAVGDCVRITGPKIGNRFQVTKVDIGVPGQHLAVGIIVKKFDPTMCVVHFHGPLRNVYLTLSPGRAYLVGTDSKVAKAGDVNYPVSGSDFFQQIGVATSTNELLVIPLDSSFGASPGGSARWFNQPFNEPPDGVRTIFTTALPFKHGGVDSESVYYSGQRLWHGLTSDYVVAESGGPGTGYDAVIMVQAPKVWANMQIDFVPDV
jgi:hypothetical protein